MNGTHNVCCDWKNWPSSYCNAICLRDIINELNNSHLCIFTTNKGTSIREEKTYTQNYKNNRMFSENSAERRAENPIYLT